MLIVKAVVLNSSILSLITVGRIQKKKPVKKDHSRINPRNRPIISVFSVYDLL